MKMTTKLYILLSMVLLTALAAFAQVTNAPTGEVATASKTVVTTVKTTVQGNPVLVTMWNGLVVALVPVLIVGVRKVIPAFPKITWPILAVLMGVAADWLLSVSGAIPNSSWETGALCGAAGVGLREVMKQLSAMTITGDVEPQVTVPSAPPSLPPDKPPVA